MDVYIKDTKVTLSPIDSIGKGGEAEVYKWGGFAVAVKIYKDRYHIDFRDEPDLGIVAEKKIEVSTRTIDLLNLQ